MGKIVKYCGSCEEGFAEKFGFCPNCGAALQKFEMKPVEVEPTPAREPVEEVTSVLPVHEPTPVTQPLQAVAPVIETAAIEPDVSEWIEEPEISEAPEPGPEQAVIAAAPVFVQQKAVDVDRVPVSLEEEHNRYARDGGFYVTVIEEKNVGQRNLLLLGTLGIVLFALMTGVVVSIFSKDLEVGSINDDMFNAVLVDDLPMDVQEEIKQNKDKNAGGGGGGGKEEKTPASKGDLPDQAPNPTRPADVNTPRMENPSLLLPPPQTQGPPRQFVKNDGRWGVLNGASDPSNGPGTGGGIGSGRGTGVGSGNGTGIGSGNGSGYGGGNGNGVGDGNGDGFRSSGPPRAIHVGVTQGIKILSKPRPGYTDAARQANIQGTVILRVTFLSSGQVGGISAVKGLPNGLTEQAIAAAHRIAFEPAKVNGVPQSVTKQIEYTFSIY